MEADGIVRVSAGSNDVFSSSLELKCKLFVDEFVLYVGETCIMIPQPFSYDRFVIGPIEKSCTTLATHNTQHCVNREKFGSLYARRHTDKITNMVASKTALLSKSFFGMSSRIYNKIPKGIREIENIKLLRKKILNY